MATQENSTQSVTDKKSLLLQAIDDDDVSMVTELILNQNVSPNFYLNDTTPICKAATKGNVEVLEVLLKANCILNTPHVQDSMWQRQPVHIAASLGHVQFIRKLIDSDVDVNTTDNDGRTALHWAVIYSQKEIIEYLLSANAAINYCQVDGFTALHAAACFGHVNVSTMLVNKGANVHITDGDGWTALHTAVCYGHLDVVKTMIAAGASINVLTKEKENVLHVAASSGNLDVVKFLVAHNIPLDDKNLNGLTAFHLGIYHNKYLVSKYLMEAGANIQTVNKFGQTTCHDVAVRMDEKFLYLLINGGYNFSKESWIHEGTFPITASKSCDYENVCQQMRFLASNARNLRDICCLRIRHILGTNFKEKVELISLPKILRKIIANQNMCQM